MSVRIYYRNIENKNQTVQRCTQTTFGQLLLDRKKKVENLVFYNLLIP